MAANNQFQDTLSMTGLGAVSQIVPNADTYMVRVKHQIPSLSKGAGASQLVTVINKNGSPVMTGVAGASGAETKVVCAANDTISVVLSSSAPADQGLNVIQSTITISQGY